MNKPLRIKNVINFILEWKGTPYIALILVFFFLLLPFYWTLITSFKEMSEIYSWPPTFIPKDFSLSGYIFTLLHSPVPRYLLNSTYYSLISSSLVTFLGTITIYGLTMFPYRGSKKILFLFFGTRLIPPQALWLPFIIIYSSVGLINTRLGVILFEVALIYPLSVWMLRGLFESIPKELVDSATIDGCSRLGALFRVIFPVAAPAISAIAIISFLWAWGEFMFPFLTLNSESLQPVTVGIYYFIGEEGVLWNALSAAQIFTILPGVIFFIIAQKNIVKGLASGSVKG